MARPARLPVAAGLTPTPTAAELLAQEFAAALPGDPEVVGTSDADATYLAMSWNDGSKARVALQGTNVHWLNLRSERKGLYTDLAELTPAFFGGRGFETFTAAPVDQEAEEILRKRLNWRDHPEKQGYIITDL